MNKVFWLGVGASTGSEVPGWPQGPPTIKRFFKAGHDLGLHQQEYFASLFEVIRRRWGIAEDALIADEPQVTIETLLSFFDIEERNLRAGEAPRRHTPTQDDRDLPQRLRGYIREVLFRNGGVLQTWESCVLHSAIASGSTPLDSTDAVISFNYDLIMDKALADTGQWNEWAGYVPMTFDKIHDVGGPHTNLPSRLPRRSNLTYLKLHGSINWFRSTGLRWTLESEERSRIEQDPNHPQQLVFSLFSSTNRDLMNTEMLYEGQYLEQLLVPPTLHKDYERFRPLWEKAEEVLATAKELVIIGFSFAPADVQAQWLLHRGLTRNPNVVSVMLVDRDENTRERIGKVIHSITSRHQVTRQYDDFGKYVREQHGSITTPKGNEPVGV